MHAVDLQTTRTYCMFRAVKCHTCGTYAYLWSHHYRTLLWPGTVPPPVSGEPWASTRPIYQVDCPAGLSCRCSSWSQLVAMHRTDDTAACHPWSVSDGAGSDALGTSPPHIATELLCGSQLGAIQRKLQRVRTSTGTIGVMLQMLLA